MVLGSSPVAVTSRFLIHCDFFLREHKKISFLEYESFLKSYGILLSNDNIVHSSFDLRKFLSRKLNLKNVSIFHFFICHCSLLIVHILTQNYSGTSNVHQLTKHTSNLFDSFLQVTHKTSNKGSHPH